MGRSRVIDFHSHILPGIDDGSKNTDMSLAMLREMTAQGVDVCVATPHFYGWRRSVESFLERRTAAWEHLSRRLEDGMPQILLGAEVAFFLELPELDDLDALCIQGTNILLLEMPFQQWTDAELDVVTRLCITRGYQVMLAHLERFLPLQKNRDILERILMLPVLVQLNAECLLPLFKRKPYLELLRRGEAHLLGSDCHNLESRPPELGAGRDIIERKLGESVLHRIDQLGSRLLAEALAAETKEKERL